MITERIIIVFTPLNCVRGPPHVVILHVVGELFFGVSVQLRSKKSKNLIAPVQRYWRFITETKVETHHIISLTEGNMPCIFSVKVFEAGVVLF